MKYRWWLLLLWMCAVRGQDTTEVRQVDLSEITLWAPKSSESLLLSPLALRPSPLAILGAKPQRRFAGSAWRLGTKRG
jgi:hypothetical protein